MFTFTSNSFVTEVEEIRSKSNMEYIDAVVHWCEKNKVEVEFIAAFIKKDLVFKSKLQEEAEYLNIIKKTARLPI